MPPSPAVQLPPLPPLPELTGQPLASQLKLVRFQAEDADALIPIEARSFGVFHWTAQAFKNELQNQLAHYYVLKHKATEQVLGYIGCWFVAEEGHITTLATHPELRGHGLGELLLAQVYRCAEQSNVHSLTLEVRTSNFAAQNLYYKYGFRQVGIRPRYYQDNAEDALLFTTPELALPEQKILAHEGFLALQRRLGGWPDGHMGLNKTLSP
jgi:[ribosomal protein S18]-alanine N-acetyltransferase